MNDDSEVPATGWSPSVSIPNAADGVTSSEENLGIKKLTT